MANLKRHSNYEDDNTSSKVILLHGSHPLINNTPIIIPSNSDASFCNSSDLLKTEEYYQALEKQLNEQYCKITCNFVQRPGQIYHLYERQSDQLYFGMLSPEEWGKVPHRFLGSFRFGEDHRWTAIRN